MSLVSLIWSNTSASDIHLLPGLVSPELKRLLRAGDLDSATNEVEEKQLINMAGLNVAFAAQLTGMQTNQDVISGHGISMSTKTGEVMVDSASMKGHSFLITATATQGAATATARIRVNVHDAIDRLWLTPKVLTVRKGAKNMRLSVLAQFDDGVIGDITNWSPFEKPAGPSDHTYVRPKDSDNRVLAWESEIMSGTSKVTVDLDTGVLNATGESGITKVTVRRQGGAAASASVVCAQPWSTPVRLTHISGPGVKEVNFVPNILFLPDGFQEGDKGAYERLVRFVVTRLSTRNRTRPFAAFTGRINYFMAWVPSPDPGISVLNELYQNRRDKSGESRGVDLPSVLRRAPDKWKLEDLINAIGLPTPKNDPIISTPGGDRLSTWQSLYGPEVTKPRLQPLFGEWLDRNDRMLLNERDTAFHMAFGDRPALDGETSDRGIAINPRRLHDDDFNTFLDSLRGPKGEALGNPLWTSGKDNDLVVVLCRSTRHGGVNVGRTVPGSDSGHTLGVSLGDNTVHRFKPNPGGDGFDLVPDAIPTEVHFRIWLTTAHELAHSWTLGDEYGGDTRAPTGDQIADSTQRANIQARSTLLTGTGELSTIHLKWGEWPRIAKAGVLAINPAPAAGGKLTLTLRDGKAAGFKPKDIVRLRTRPLPVAAAPSARCKVESVNGDQLVIVPLFGAVDPAKFPAGSIVMAPVRSQDKNPAADLFGDDLTLADPDVLIRIGLTGNPLNAQPIDGEGKAPNDPFNRPCRNVELSVPTAATNFPDRKAPKPPDFSSWTIGLYENGGHFNCGIYRPTGVCLMSESAHKDPKTKDITLYDFCIICRYAIVDAVDPTLHGEVEQDFRVRYGKRGAVP